MKHKSIGKIFKGVGTGGLYAGGGTLVVLYSIISFAVPAIVGLGMIWESIQMFRDGSIIWGLVVLFIGTPIAVTIASWLAPFLMFAGIIALVIWGIIKAFGLNVAFDSVWSMVLSGLVILFLGWLAFSLLSSLFKRKENTADSAIVELEAPKKKRKVLGILSLIFGIIGLFWWSSVMGIVAIVMGVIQFRQGRTKFAIAGLILGAIDIVLQFIWYTNGSSPSFF